MSSGKVMILVSLIIDYYLSITIVIIIIVIVFKNCYYYYNLILILAYFPTVLSFPTVDITSFTWDIYNHTLLFEITDDGVDYSLASSHQLISRQLQFWNLDIMNVDNISHSMQITIGNNSVIQRRRLRLVHRFVSYVCVCVCVWLKIGKIEKEKKKKRKKT